MLCQVELCTVSQSKQVADAGPPVIVENEGVWVCVCVCMRMCGFACVCARLYMLVCAVSVHTRSLIGGDL